MFPQRGESLVKKPRSTSVARRCITSKLRQIRKEKNLTQKDVASQTGLSQQMVSKIESFNGNPSMLSFLKYCNCIGVDINTMLSYFFKYVD